MGNSALNLVQANSLISGFDPGSCPPNWLQGKARISNPARKLMSTSTQVIQGKHNFTPNWRKIAIATELSETKDESEGNKIVAKSERTEEKKKKLVQSHISKGIIHEVETSPCLQLDYHHHKSNGDFQQFQNLWVLEALIYTWNKNININIITL